MKNYKALAVILLAGFSFSCKTTDEDFFTINESKIKAQYTTEDILNLEVDNPKTQKIDSVVYTINDKKVGSSKSNSSFSFPLKSQKLGYQNIKAAIHYDGATELDSTRIEVISNLEPKILKFTLINTYPHDNKAYTQGLEFYNGVLYEGTGQRGESTLRKTNYKTGNIDLKKAAYHSIPG